MHNIPYRSQLAPAATADEEQMQEELEHAEPADAPDGAGLGFISAMQVSILHETTVIG